MKLKGMKLTDGSTVTGEMCRCGHPGSKHKSSAAGSPGQGVCKVRGCPCKQFTWVRFTTDRD